MDTKLSNLEENHVFFGNISQRRPIVFVEKKVSLGKADLTATNRTLNALQGPTLLIPHKTPDIDAWTATVTMAQMLANKKIPVIIYSETGSIPEYYTNLLDSQKIPYQSVTGAALQETPVNNVIFLDTGDIGPESKQFDDTVKAFLKANSFNAVLNIDHHEPNPPRDGKAELTVPHSLVITSLLSAAGITLALRLENQETIPAATFATTILLGIVADTQRFTVKNSRALNEVLYQFAKNTYAQTRLTGGTPEIKKTWNDFCENPTPQNWDTYIDAVHTLCLALSFSPSDKALGDTIMQEKLRPIPLVLDAERTIVSLSVDQSVALGNARIYIMDKIAHDNKNTGFVLLTFFDEKKKTHALSFRNYNAGMPFNLKSVVADYFAQQAAVYEKVDLYGHPGAGGINLTVEQYNLLIAHWPQFLQFTKDTLDNQREKLQAENIPEVINRINALLNSAGA